jgi:type VI protein secretion system component VasK
LGKLEEMEMLASDYPAMGIFWSMLWFFIWIIWIMLLFRVIGDIFRSRDLGGFAKVMWLLLVIVVPFFGVFVYMIARGQAMAQHDMDAAQARDEQMRAYVQQAIPSSGSADELAKLAELNRTGVLTDAEFAQEKAKILA